ncbi:hypothetical protein Y032_0086g1976 [Ancylostoma ceylanicum]|uniref:Secreted protein n=1 Tax=Ancylostoma ceylanicum TaxID=53326 RepID=A0A016TPQ5_9BILA|nr:hypothetical protein Y032_0086g1976 [Ancylostoma ceylanicum]
MVCQTQSVIILVVTTIQTSAVAETATQPALNPVARLLHVWIVVITNICNTKVGGDHDHAVEEDYVDVNISTTND